MEENDENLYETRTSLVSCENVVEYLWSKCTKYSLPFKPEKANTINATSVFSDIISGNIIERDYKINKEDIKRINLKKNIDYEVDTIEFTTLDKENKPLTKGNVLVIYISENRFYSVFLLDDDNNLKLLIKSSQRKDSAYYKTDMVEYF